MSVVRRPAALLFAVASVVSFSDAAPIPKDFKPKNLDYFPTAIGSRWEYVVDGTDTLDHVREVTAEEKLPDGSRTAEFHWTSHAGKYGSDTTYRVDATGVARIGFGKGSRFDVPYLMLKLDAKPGETWDGGIDRPGPGGKPAYTCKRGEVETITTPAGKFEATPVSMVGGSTNTYWYAPGVGLVKWQNGNRTIVLSKYTPAKEAKK